MPERQVPDTVIGPPRPSGADFFLPQRGAKSLDAARVRIVRGGARQGTRTPDDRSSQSPPGSAGERG